MVCVVRIGEESVGGRRRLTGDQRGLGGRLRGQQAAQRLAVAQDPRASVHGYQQPLGELVLGTPGAIGLLRGRKVDGGGGGGARAGG